MRDRRDWRGVLHPGPLVGLRAFGWGVALVVLAGGAASLTSMLLLHVLHFPKDGPLSAVGLGLALAAMLAVYVAAVRLGEKRSADELALPFLGRELAAGLIGGVGLFAVVMLLLLVLGAYSISGPTPGTPWIGLQVGFGPGFAEELLFRGILMRLLWEAFGARVALAVSATVFGLLHLLNPGHDVVGPVSIIFEAGLPLGALYLLTGRLWASIGAHAGWNFAQGYIFGASVSGTQAGGHFFLATQRPGVPAWLSGGAFGPEASVAGLLAGTIAGVLLLLWARQRRLAAAWVIQ
jgi:membrane protease YdiL (CAAX protease family)